MALATRRIPFARPCLEAEDRQAVLEVLQGSLLTHGPQGAAFEAEFAAFIGTEAAHCVAVSSCTAALHLACLQLGLGPGDEVLVPAQTHTATAHVVEVVGARPVFVDCDPASGNVTAERLAAACTPRTRAVIVVHFIGIPCDMPAIAAFARARRLFLIEDCATALGARVQGRHVGLFGDAAAFSFYPAKHLTTGEGGMFVSQDAALAAAVRYRRAFGVDRSHHERALPGQYDVFCLGLNYRLSELQAALGRGQLRRLPATLARRHANYAQLAAGLREVPGVRLLAPGQPEAEHAAYCASVVLEGQLAAQRDALIARLNAAGVGTSIYYPHPVPRLRYYRQKYGYDAARFPHATTLSDASLALPVGPHLDAEDVAYLVATFRTLVEEMQP
ncbi:MAG: aminotransferase DegT [Candidatus Tectimicrobiota bacterium]|nr:MAG: aminotransferase DegT [Candidatus Tectomicrobia bacterium]